MNARTPDPYDFAEARAAHARTTEAQKDSERAYIEATAALALAEQIYKKALARRLVELHADGCAWTVAGDLARGDEKVAQLRYERDVAKGVLKAAELAGWRHAANRKACQGLADWSARVAPFGDQQVPSAPVVTYGSRRAA